MKNTALSYAKLACDTMMNKFAAEDLPPKGGFHYHQGVFLSGMMNTYSVCGEEKYFQYIKDWVDSIIIDDGTIKRFFKGALDDYMAGILLFPLLERTGDKKYKTALDLLTGNIHNWLRNKEGGFWHKEWNPEQMWLDGLYMAGPIQAMYAKRFDKGYMADEAAFQAKLMYNNMQNPESKLLHHVWHCRKEVPLFDWADKETGLSSEVWGRAMGWYVVATLDIMEEIGEEHPDYNTLAEIERELLAALLKYQDAETGMWYQVVDKGHLPDNWVETSASCLFVYALAKAMRMGVLENKYTDEVKRGFDGIVENFVAVENGNLSLSGVCIGTGICDYKGYIERPTSINDLHGMGAFLLMCAELAR